MGASSAPENDSRRDPPTTPTALLDECSARRHQLEAGELPCDSRTLRPIFDRWWRAMQTMGGLEPPAFPRELFEPGAWAAPVSVSGRADFFSVIVAIPTDSIKGVIKAVEGWCGLSICNNVESQREYRTSTKESVGNPADAGREPAFVFRPDGDGYFLRGLGEQGHVRRLKGFDAIFRLIQTPGKPVPMVDLAAGFAGPAVAQGSSRQETLDTEAVAQCRKRLQEAKAELEQAKADNDHAKEIGCQVEIEAVERELKTSTGIGFRQRDLDKSADKLRSRILNALSRAYDALRKSNPPFAKLAEHFELSISSESGASVYCPAGFSIEWKTKA